MATEPITIQLESPVAERYKSAAPEDQKKMDALINLWLKDLTSKDQITLKELMDEIGRKAHERGMTPEILQSILNEQ